jgi:hypothetical protein
MLMDLAATAGLFHTPTGVAYADISIEGHRETWAVRSPRFRAWLRRRYYEATRDVPSAAALNAALNLIEAQAQFDGPERGVHVRVAEHAGRIYLDLADAAWRAVEIAPQGWRVITDPPVRFRRPMRETAGSRSTMPSKPTRWRPMCAHSWPSRSPGPGALAIGQAYELARRFNVSL